MGSSTTQFFLLFILLGSYEVQSFKPGFILPSFGWLTKRLDIQPNLPTGHIRVLLQPINFKIVNEILKRISPSFIQETSIATVLLTVVSTELGK